MEKQMSLKALRVNEKLTQTEAAAGLGVSQKTISNWEKGITHPNQKAIEKICEFYGVSYDFIDFDA